MKKISVSLNPTYLCNFRCDFCYLTLEQLADTKKIDLEKLYSLLREISDQGYYVEHVDLYGGEIALLSEQYLEELDQVLYNHSDSTINVITNLSKINPYFLKEHIDLSVSFDFEARERHDQVLLNMMSIKKDISVLLLASPKLMELDVDNMIRIFSGMQNIISVEIKPYSSNQANNLSVTDKDFEEFVKKWITSEVPKNFALVNQVKILESLNGQYNAYSDNHVYITPNGKFGVLEFDENDNEFFLELDNFKDYLNWADKEKRRVKENSFCSKCEFQGHCLTEHYREVKSLANSCNGFKHLLDWAKGHFS